MESYQHLETLFGQLFNLGPILPGSINKQNVKCGKEGCHCMKEENSKKHIRFQFSFTLESKRSTVYIRKADIASAEQMTESYKKMRKITTALALESVEISRKIGATRASEVISTIFKKILNKTFNFKNVPKSMTNIIKSRDNWKERAIERKKISDKLKITNRDLISSRKKWRKEALKQRKEIIRLKDIIKEIDNPNNNILATDNSKKK